MSTGLRHAARVTALTTAGTLMLVALPGLSAPASAATAGVAITKSGYVPASRSVTVGDTVTFTNTDTDPHQVLFKQTSGFTCTATPLVVEPSKTQSCTFTAAAAYTYADPNQKGRTFRGTITVAAAPAAPTVTLVSDGKVAEYGSKAMLSGTTSPSAAGTSVDIVARAAGETTFTKVATATTNAAGAYSVAVMPEIRTTYRADVTTGTSTISSPTVLVQVSPNVTLGVRFVKKHRAYLQSKVISSITYAGKTLKVQRQNRLGGWTTLRTVTLGSFSSARFRVALPSGISRLRTLLTTAQAGSGYLGTTSNTLTLKR